MKGAHQDFGRGWTPQSRNEGLDYGHFSFFVSFLY